VGKKDFIKVETLPKIKKRKVKKSKTKLDVESEQIDLTGTDDDAVSVASTASSVAQVLQQRESLVTALKEHKTQGLHPNIALLKAADIKSLFKDKKYGARKLQLSNPDLFKGNIHTACMLRVTNCTGFTGRLTTDRMYEMDGESWDLAHWKLLPKGVSQKQKLKMNNKTSELSTERDTEVLSAIQFTTLSQLFGAIMRRMNAMLRCGVPHSMGYIPPHERGSFIEYNYYLYTLAHELTYDSIMDWDMAIFELRRNGEWTFDLPVPQHSDIRSHWIRKQASSMTCIFCGMREFICIVHCYLCVLKKV